MHLNLAHGLLSGIDCHWKHNAGRGDKHAMEEEEGAAAFMTDQDDDDDHVKLLNPVKVKPTVCSVESANCCLDIILRSQKDVAMPFSVIQHFCMAPGCAHDTCTSYAYTSIIDAQVQARAKV